MICLNNLNTKGHNMKKLIPIIFAIITILSSCKKSEDIKPYMIITEQKDSLNVSFTLHSNRTPFWFYRRVNGFFKTTQINSNDTIIKDPYDKTNGIYKNIVTMQTSGKTGDYLSIKGVYLNKSSFSETINNSVYFAWVAQENYK